MMEVVEMVQMVAQVEMVQTVTQVPVATTATGSTTCSSLMTRTKLYFKPLKPLLWREQDCLEVASLLQELLVLSELASPFSLQTRDSFWMRPLFQELPRVRSHLQDIQNGPPKDLLNGASLKCDLVKALESQTSSG